ncbi:GTP-binding protein [Methanolobus profundi]|uniref:GTPase, G3E family n=1 Tax=Methanolobus profundi TaxID=487685 RepID=A0A1I4NS07_9EURY|nr:GTP-binding protein [Methanolobus profundi]SFM18312.1 GTPase, G3E family [Methanolobus profundi]
MKIVIISGFLGSGKTTSVIRIGKYLQSKGLSVSVLVNDIGDVGVDGHVISENGLRSKEIPRGCICCTLKYALEGNIALVQAQYDPDILLIEPTGVAFPLRIKEQIEMIDLGPEVTMGPIIGMIDGSKFEDLMQHSGDAITKQIGNADIILLNKKDLLSTSKLSEFETAIKEINPDAEFHSLSLKWDDGSFAVFADSFFRDLKEDVHSFGMDHDAAGSAGTDGSVQCDPCTSETDEFNHFNVSSYADSYSINSSTELGHLTHLALDLIGSIKKRVMELNPRFLGHLKMFLHTGSVSFKISVTSYQDQPEIEYLSIGANEGGKMTVFAAVTDITRDDIADIIDDAVSSRSGQFGIIV